jgi:hypothetical protein
MRPVSGWEEHLRGQSGDFEPIFRMSYAQNLRNCVAPSRVHRR